MAWYPTDDISPSYKDAFLKTYYQENLIDDTENCNAPLAFPLNGDPITVLAEYTPLEFQKILDCLLQGAVVIYPNEINQIWWSFVRQLDCPMSFCEPLVECITNDINTQNAIQLITGGDSNINGNPLKWQQLAIEPVESCDLDQTWGYVKALWDFINQQNIDFLQQLSEATNTAEQIGIMISAIPLFSLLPFDEVAEWIGKLGEYNLEAYESSITTVVNEQIWCDLFCLAIENDCSLTFEDLWDYMLEKFGGANFPTLGATFVELVAFMATGTYANDRIVYLWTLVQLGIAFIGGRFLNTNNMNTIAIHAQTGDPDNDWELLCGECSWAYVSDFPTDEDGWFAFAGIPPFTDAGAVYVQPVWTYTDVEQFLNFYIRATSIQYDLVSTHIDDITIHWDITKGVYTAPTDTAIAIICSLTGGGYSVKTIGANVLSNGVGETTLNVNDNVESIRAIVRCSTALNILSLTGDSEITQINVTGTGTNPFV